jgi:5-methyltetrahydrofolate--homocysteine methyltransferase
MDRGHYDFLQCFLATGIVARGRVALGTVKGGLRDSGENLVGMMLERAGFQIVDLGTNVAPERFAQTVRDHAPQVSDLSALLTTTMQNMRSMIEALEDLAVCDRVKVIIGSALTADSFANDIGANGYASDANRAVSLAKPLV